MSRMLLAASLAAAWVVAPAAASAQQVGLVGSVDRADPDSRADDVYRGVVPGSRSTPPRARRLAKTRQTFVTWPGFEMIESGSRIFVQTTRPVTYRRADEPNRIVLVLERTRIHLWNNHNPLVTEHFNTPVARAYLRHSRRDTLLILEMKVGSEPTIRQTSEGEYNFLFIEFPAGSYPRPAGSVPSTVDEPPRTPPADDGLSVRSVD